MRSVLRIFVLCLAVSVLSFGAGVFFDGIAVDGQVTCGDGYATYDPDAGILTLVDAVLVSGGGSGTQPAISVKGIDTLTIVLKGKSRIEGYATGIDCLTKTLKISGTGGLSIVSSGSGIEYSGLLTVQSGWLDIVSGGSSILGKSHPTLPSSSALLRIDGGNLTLHCTSNEETVAALWIGSTTRAVVETVVFAKGWLIFEAGSSELDAKPFNEWWGDAEDAGYGVFLNKRSKYIKYEMLMYLTGWNLCSLPFECEFAPWNVNQFAVYEAKGFAYQRQNMLPMGAYWVFNPTNSTVAIPLKKVGERTSQELKAGKWNFVAPVEGQRTIEATAVWRWNGQTYSLVASEDQVTYPLRVGVGYLVFK